MIATHRHGRWLVLGVGLVWCAAMIWLQTARLQANVHYEYEDDPLYLQVLDGIGSREVPRNTIHPKHRPSHVTPAYYALWPVWRALGGGWLAAFILRALIFASGAFAAYLLCERKGLAPGLCAALACLWLCWPPTVVLTTSTLRPLSLAAAPLLWMLGAWETRRVRELLLWGALVLLIREDLALTVALLSGVGLLQRRTWRWVVAPAAIAGVWFLVTTRLVLPLMIGGDYDQVVLQDNVGSSVLDALLEPSHVLAVLAIGVPLLMLPLGAAISLAGLVGAGSIMINTYPMQPNLVHLTTPLVSAAFAGAIVVLSRAPVTERPDSAWRRLTRGRLVLGVWLATLMCHVQPWLPPTISNAPVVSDAPDGPHEVAWSPLHPALFRQSERDRHRWSAVAAVPDGASVTAVGHLLPMLAPRRDLYEYGHRYVPFLRAEYAVLEAGCISTAAGAHDTIPDGMLAAHVRELTASGWRQVAAHGAVVVLRRSGESPRHLTAQLRAGVEDCAGERPGPHRSGAQRPGGPAR